MGNSCSTTIGPVQNQCSTRVGPARFKCSVQILPVHCPPVAASSEAQCVRDSPTLGHITFGCSLSVFHLAASTEQNRYYFSFHACPCFRGGGWRERLRWRYGAASDYRSYPSWLSHLDHCAHIQATSIASGGVHLLAHLRARSFAMSNPELAGLTGQLTGRTPPRRSHGGGRQHSRFPRVLLRFHTIVVSPQRSGCGDAL